MDGFIFLGEEFTCGMFDWFRLIIILLSIKPFLFQILQERETLPVKKFEQEILDAIHQNSVVIIRGATGCGKTTQVPQYILDEYIHGGRAAECNIVVTQVKMIFRHSICDLHSI